MELGSHSWYEKHFSQPSQKQSGFKHPTDTLTNKREFKITVAASGVVADVGTTETLVSAEI